MADYLKDINIQFLTVQLTDIENLHNEINSIYQEAFNNESYLISD